MHISPEQEKEILDLIAQTHSQEKGYRLMVASFSEPLYWHIRSIVVSHDDTDDILQSVFIKVWKNIGSFRGESRLYTWLFRIATNEAITFLRKKKKHHWVSFEDYTETSGNISSGTETALDGDSIQIILTNALNLLPEKQRVVFVMKYFEEMKYEEMAELTGTSEGALKASYHHAVKKIEKYVRSLNL